MNRVYDKGDTPLVFPQFENEEKMSESDICVRCTGCCRYVTVEIDKPRSKEKIQLYTWYLLHKNVQIYIDNEGAWNLLFITPCTELGTDGRCGIYTTRPKICKDYSPKSCSRTGKDHTHLFMTPDALNEYLEEEKKKRKKKTSKKNNLQMEK